MAKEILIVSDTINLGTGRLALAVSFADYEKREDLSSVSNEKIIQRYEGMPITVKGENYTLNAEILRVNVSSSITNFKNIFFEISTNDHTGRIAELDEVHFDS